MFQKSAQEPSPPTQQEIPVLSDAEMERWNSWLASELAKMSRDPDSVLFQAILVISDARCEALMKTIEKDIPPFVKGGIDALRKEITEQQDTRERTWLQKLMSW